MATTSFEWVPPPRVRSADDFVRALRALPHQRAWKLHGRWVTRQHLSWLPPGITDLTLSYVDEVHVDDLLRLRKLVSLDILLARTLVAPSNTTAPAHHPSIKNLALEFMDFLDDTSTVFTDEDAVMRTLLAPQLEALSIRQRTFVGNGLQGHGTWSLEACTKLELLHLGGLHTLQRDIAPTLPSTLRWLHLEHCKPLKGARWDWEHLEGIYLVGVRALPRRLPRGLQEVTWDQYNSFSWSRYSPTQ